MLLIRTPSIPDPLFFERARSCPLFRQQTPPECRGQRRCLERRYCHASLPVHSASSREGTTDDSRYFDLYTKGGKLRRLYIPKRLRTETLEWLEEMQRSSGFLFLNRYGERITTRGISQQLKNYADKYGLDKKVVYPHSFRHRYAKNFLEKYNDIALLADLMGHESIETTRIYLRRTASEQQALVDKIVTW